MLYSYFHKYTDNIFYYVPHRFKEGYGVSAKGIAHAIKEKVELLITIDCGIKSAKLLNEAKAAGIDVIICDHHLPDDNLPKVNAILNPKQIDCHYPYDELCGCGIGFKLITAVEGKLENNLSNCYQYLDLVASAIAADIVPMTGENRVLATMGIDKANNNPLMALQVIKKIAGFEKSFTISDLVFMIAPRVNAAGRMDDAATAIKLFLCEQYDDAMQLATMLNNNNIDRRETDALVTDEALAMLNDEDASHYKATILYRAHWHKGVVGIVASRLIEKRHQPTIILTESNGKISGSARSIPGLNMFEALSKCSHHLESFGGHYYAAGLTMEPDNFVPFKEEFNEIVKSTLSQEDFIPVINIDGIIELKDITNKLFNIVHQMEPFGPLNMRPIFVSKNVNNHNDQCAIIKEKHIKFMVTQNGYVVKGIGFNLADKFAIVDSGKPFDICYTLELNTWNNISNVEIRVLDIKPTV